MLEVEGLRASYAGVPALHGIDLQVANGQYVGIIGPNGAGKTTLAKSLSATVTSEASVMSLDGVDLLPLGGHQRVNLGIVHVPQGRRVFGGLSVEENLLMGAYRPAARRNVEARRRRVFDLFPVLADMRQLSAGALSGGQQQMLAVGRGLMAEPRLLILDEPSQGLAPLIVEEIFDVLAQLREDGELSVLLIEQLAQEAMDLCDLVVVLESGEVVARGTEAELANRTDVVDAYLGQI